MSILQTVKDFFGVGGQQNLGWNGHQGNAQGAALPYQTKPITQTVKDIQHWKRAVQLWQMDEMPRTYELQLIYKEVAADLRVTSQMGNRLGKTRKASFGLKSANGEVNVEATKALKKMPVYRQLINAILKAQYFGHSVGELRWEINKKSELFLKFESIARTNIVPIEGKFYPDYMEDKSIDYRELQEYGDTILEFIEENDEDEFHMGMFNKLVPFVLMKKFAVSCNSEHLEINGVPPRYLKTDTNNKTLLARAKKMMQEMGHNAWAVLDNSETLEFVQSVASNGEIYKNFIHMLNEEMSLAITGAIVGQDTKNGSNGKEKTSQNLLADLVTDDMELVEQIFNEKCMPALEKLGVVPKGHIFEFDEIENLDELWGRVKDTQSSFSYDTEWLNDKFSLKITGEKTGNITPPDPKDKNLGLPEDFFG